MPPKIVTLPMPERVAVLEANQLSFVRELERIDKQSQKQHKEAAEMFGSLWREIRKLKESAAYRKGGDSRTIYIVGVVLAILTVGVPLLLK